MRMEIFTSSLLGLGWCSVTNDRLVKEKHTSLNFIGHWSPQKAMKTQKSGKFGMLFIWCWKKRCNCRKVTKIMGRLNKDENYFNKPRLYRIFSDLTSYPWWKESFFSLGTGRTSFTWDFYPCFPEDNVEIRIPFWQIHCFAEEVVNFIT